MRLADFILLEMEAILAQWDAFAATRLPAAANLKPKGLRDHAREMLEAVAKDLSTAQTREAQSAKSTGGAPRLVDAPETAAQTHALLRAGSGFDINQLAAEYRALRASVLRLWMDACHPTVPDLEDMMRFNEAIDQALAESVEFFSIQVDQARNLLLGMLGHDMRSPLQTIQATASYLVALNAGSSVSQAASRLIRSGARMQALLDDLVDFNRVRLGLGINIVPADVDLAALFAEELNQIRSAYPDQRVDLEVSGSTRCYLDGRRLQQLLGNLVLNAVRYGERNGRVRVVLRVSEKDTIFEVRNNGLHLEQSTLDRFFEPLARGPERELKAGSDHSLGLGLYIAHEIAQAHGGEINARSEHNETVFSVRLPRQTPEPAKHAE